MVKRLSTMRETWVRSLGQVDSPEWGHKESDITEQLHFHFLSLLSFADSGSGTPWFKVSEAKLQQD